jgi:hypothetical protein
LKTVLLPLRIILNISLHLPSFISLQVW